MEATVRRSNWVLANGVRTHYSACGENGPTVVLVHGGGPGSSGLAGWRFMLPALGAHFRVFAIDQVAFGLTDARPHAWPTKGYLSLVDHLSDFIDALCIDEVMLVGNSQGAYVAAKYALENPEKVKKLFLIGSATIALAMGMTYDMTSAGTRKFDGSADSMRAFLESLLVDKSTITDELIAERLRNTDRPGWTESNRTFITAGNAMLKDPNLFQRFEVSSRLPRLTIPTRFVWGNQDTRAPLDLARGLEKLLPNIPFEYIDQAGHQVQTDQPALVNKMVLDFFRG